MATTSQGRVGAWRGGWNTAAALRSLREEWHRRRAYNKAVRELRALSERELADLGISRTMISRVAAEAAYGRR